MHNAVMPAPQRSRPVETISAERPGRATEAQVRTGREQLHHVIIADSVERTSGRSVAERGTRRVRPHRADARRGRFAPAAIGRASSIDAARLSVSAMPLPPATVILLGAGASDEAGVPMSVPMTTRLVNRIGADRQSHVLASALHFVCGAILAYDAAEGEDPLGGPPDVERVFAAIRLLEERRDLEVTPFVASWHPAVDAWDRDTAHVAPANFDQQLQDALLSGNPAFGNAQALILALIQAQSQPTQVGRTYRRLADRMLAALQAAVATTPKKVGYLRPLVRQARHLGQLTIATLNYDLSIEQAATAEEIPVETGIEHWISTGRWSWPNDGIRLLKLHGSINWFFAGTHTAGHLPRNVVEVTAHPEPGRRPALLFGQRGKLQAEGPFLGLLAEFENALSSAQQLVVIGYSFRDDHVNDVVTRWSAEDVGRRLLIVDPFWPQYTDASASDQGWDFRAQLHQHLSGSALQGIPARLAVWRMRSSVAIERLANSPADLIDSELGQRLIAKPRVLGVASEAVRWPGRQLSLAVKMTSMPPGWVNLLSAGLQTLPAVPRRPLHAHGKDDTITIAFPPETTPAEAHQALVGLIDSTQATFETRLEKSRQEREACSAAAARFRAALRLHDPDGRVLDITATRRTETAPVLVTVGLHLPDDVDKVTLAGQMIGTLTSRGQSGVDIRVGPNSVTFPEAALAAEELLPLLDCAIADSRQIVQAARTDSPGCAERQRFLDEFQALLNEGEAAGQV